MENSIIVSNKDEEVKVWWECKKKELLDGIDATIKDGNTEMEVLEIMKEIVENAKVKSSISKYYDEIEDKGVF